MITKKLCSVLAVLCLSFLSYSAFSYSDYKEPLDADEAFSPQYWAKDGGFYVGFEIPDGYYLYTDETKVSTSEGKVIDGRISNNKKMVPDPTFGDVDVYYEKALYFYPNVDNLESLNLTYRGCMEDTLCYLPQIMNISPLAGSGPSAFDELFIDNNELVAIDESVLEVDSSKSGLAIALVFFLAGLGLSFTPCVLPMVPVLASIITSSAKSGAQARLLALSYGLGVVIAYMALGAGIALLSSSLNISALMQSAWFVAPLAALFLVFGLITMGVINLPRLSAMGKSDERIISLQSKLQGMGYLGSLLAGLVSVLVLSPCVSAPLGAAVAYLASEGTFLSSITSLGALSIGMILPLMIATTVGHRFLPKAGPWMNKIKVLAGCVMILMALWTVLKIVPTQVAPVLIAITFYYISLFLINLVRNNEKKYKVLLAFCIIMPLVATLGLSTIKSPLLGTSQEAVDGRYAFDVVSTKHDLDSFLLLGDRQLVYVGADWCQSCRSLEKNFFPSDEFKEAALGLSVIKLDITKNDSETTKWMSDYGIYGAPGFLIFDNKELVKSKMGEDIKAEYFKK